MLLTKPVLERAGRLLAVEIDPYLAERLCGRPCTAEPLWSLRLAPHWHLEIVDRLRRTDFEPPGVDSVLLWICGISRNRAGFPATAPSRATVDLFQALLLVHRVAMVRPDDERDHDGDVDEHSKRCDIDIHEWPLRRT